MLESTLTATGPGGTDTHTGIITVHPWVYADFSAAPVVGTLPLTVTFANSSTHASRYGWDYGDGITGTTTSVATHTHTYMEAGVYTVTLSASDGVMTNTMTRASYITACQAVTASFTATPLTGAAPLSAQPPLGTVTFTDASANATGYLWDYGDGNTGATSAPTHTHLYRWPGTYIATLTASNPASVATATASIVVPPGGGCALTGSVVTKYYYFGSQRVAMRRGDAVYYRLGGSIPARRPSFALLRTSLARPP